MSRKSSKRTKQTKVQAPVQVEVNEVVEVEQQVEQRAEVAEPTADVHEPISDESIAEVIAQAEELAVEAPAEEQVGAEGQAAGEPQAEMYAQVILDPAGERLSEMPLVEPAIEAGSGEGAFVPTVEGDPGLEAGETQKVDYASLRTTPPESLPPPPAADVTADATPATNASPAKAKKPKKDAGPTKLSALDAAAQVLSAAGKPMTCAEMIEEMSKQGLWSSPNGATPAATLYSAILRELKKGAESRFQKTERGKFAAKGE